MVSSDRFYLAYFHHLFSNNPKLIFKTINCPQLEKRHIHADMRRTQPIIIQNLAEKTV